MMDFHCMKRKQLQALCKKHKIPANLSNLDMADKLTEFLKEKENPVILAVMKEQEENVSKAESNNVVVNRKVKKVRFSPEHELIEFTRVPEIKRRSRRNSICRKDSNWSVEIVESGEVNKETVGRRGRATRTGELKIMEEEINQKKRGVKAVKCSDGKTIASAVETFDDDKLEEGDVVESGTMMRSRGKMEAQGVKNTITREKKGEKGDKRDEQASDGVINEKQEEIVDNHSRVTKSRAQKLTEAPAEVGKRGRRIVKNIGKVAAVRAEAVDNGESGADSLSKRGGDGEGTSATGSDERMNENGEGLKENLVNKQIAGERVTVEPQVLLRSKRRANMVGDSEMFNNDTKKHENGGIKGSIKTSKLLVSDGSRVDAEVIASEVNPGRRAVLKTEEPIKKVEPRRSNRRKIVIESDDLRAETANIYPLRSSVPPSDSVPEVSKDDKMVLQPIGVMKRCRRKTLSLKLDSANNTDSAVENLEAEKHVSEPCLVEKENSAVQKNTRSRRSTFKCKPPGILDKIGGDSNVHQNNKVMKRKRGHVSGEDVIKKNNDHYSGAQSLKGSSSKKVVSAAATGKFADEGKQPPLDNPNMLDASLHSPSGIGESLFLDVQLSVSKDSESASNLCSKNIISDVELTSKRDTCRKKEEVSIADSADSSCMNLTNGEELANSDTNAASKIAQLDRDSVSEGQNCTSNIREVEKGNSLLEFDAQQSTEKNITDVDKNDPEAQVYSQMEVSGSNNKINDQVLAEGLDVSGKEGSGRSSTDSLLLGDQTDVKTDLKVAEIEADERIQPCPRVVDHHNDLDHLEASYNILDNNNEDASQTAGEVSYETDYTHSMGTSKLKVPSSSMTRHHGDNVAEGNKTLFHKGIEELAEADEDGCSKEHGNASNHFSEFDMPDLCNGETREGESSKSHMSKCDGDGEFSLANLFDAEGRYGITPQDREKFSGETREGESSKGHLSKCDEDGEFNLANLFDAEGRYGITPQDGEKISGEHLVKDFDEQGMLHGSTSVAPITMCNSTGDHEANLSAEGGKTYNYKDKPSELTEVDESGCLESHKSSKDEDWEFSVFNLLDGEKSTMIELQDLPAVSTVKDLNDQEMFPDLPAVSTLCVNYNEVKSGRDSSNSQETNPSTPSSVSETQAEQQKSQLAKSSALANSNQRQEAWSKASELAGNAVCFSKSYAEGKISQVTEGLSADECVNRANYGTDKEDSAGACISDVKNCLISKIAAESLSDMKFQDSMETEQQHKNPQARLTELDAGEEATHATSRQSWAEIELHNLFGTTSDDDASPGLGDTFCQETEMANMTMSKNKSTANISGSLTKTKGEEMEGDSRNECAKTKNKDVVLPTEFNADIYENELKFLFATPVKIMTPCKIEETYSHDRILDGSVTSMKECSDTMKENVATKSTSDEKAQNAGYEVENSLCVGASLSDGRDDICEEINEVESFLSLNTSTRVLSGAEYDGCEALEDQFAQNKEDCLKESNLVTEEDREEHVIPLALSCLRDEATEKNIISSSGSPWDLYELESCAHMSETLNCQSNAHNKSEGEMTQNTEAVVELSDADLQKFDVPEKSHLLTAGSDDGNILRETSIETSSDPEVAKIGSFQKDVANKGISPFLFLKASPDCEDSIRESEDQYDAKILDEKDVNPKLSQDISDELHTNSEVAIQKSVSIGHSLCQELVQLPSSDKLESTCKEAKGMETTTQILYSTDAVAEHESYVFGAVSGLLSCSATPSCLGYHENGNINLEAGKLSDNGGDGTSEKINKVESVKLKDTSTAALSKAEYDGCEASEEQLTDNTGECQKETNFMTEDNEENVIPLGQSCFSDEGTDHDSKSTEENIISLSGSPNNLDKLKGCQDMLIDTALSECLSYNSRGYHKSEQEMAQSSEVALELSGADLQKSNVSKNSCLTACFEDDNISKEASLNTFSGPLVAELANIGSFDGQNGIDKGMICDAKAKPSQDMSDEPYINSEVAILKSLLDSDNLCEETGTTTQDLNTIVAPGEHGSSVCGAVSSNLCSSEMHLHLREANNDIENLDVGTPAFNLSGDNDEKNSEKAEENLTSQMVEFSNQEDLKNDTHTISNLPASGYNEILKESDVADTIKEYIDSESSLSVIFENSTASLSSDMLAHTGEMIACENSALSKHKDDIAGRLANSKDEDNTPSVDCPETEIKEQEEATLFIGPAQVLGNAVNSPGCVGLFAEGSTVKLDSQKKIVSEDGKMSPSNELRSTMRKNARTILIHGTPGKLLTMVDMKENAPTQKSSNIGDITAVRPAKRRALQDVQWK